MAKRTMQIGNVIYTGWKEMTIQKRIDALSASFSLSFTDNWSGKKREWPFKPGDLSVISLESQPVVTGFLDSMSVGFSIDEHTISVSGRDSVGDLVDCAAAVNDSDEFLNQSLFQIATKLASPFGIKVINRAGVLPPFKNWKVDPGETVFENLDRAAKKVGILLRSDGLGNLILSKVGLFRSDSPLIEGINVKEASGNYDRSNSYSHYYVRGQSSDRPGGGEKVTGIEGLAKDAAIKRFRPLLTISDSDLDQDGAQRQANFEASVRAARSVSVRVVTQGWTQESGRLWDVNFITRVISPSLGIDADMLISGVDFNYGDDGALTELELTRADAFTVKPQVDSKFDPIAELGA